MTPSKRQRSRGDLAALSRCARPGSFSGRSSAGHLHCSCIACIRWRISGVHRFHVLCIMACCSAEGLPLIIFLCISQCDCMSIAPIVACEWPPALLRMLRRNRPSRDKDGWQPRTRVVNSEFHGASSDQLNGGAWQWSEPHTLRLCGPTALDLHQRERAIWDSTYCRARWQ